MDHSDNRIATKTTVDQFSLSSQLSVKLEHNQTRTNWILKTSKVGASMRSHVGAFFEGARRDWAWAARARHAPVGASFTNRVAGTGGAGAWPIGSFMRLPSRCGDLRPDDLARRAPSDTTKSHSWASERPLQTRYSNVEETMPPFRLMLNQQFSVTTLRMQFRHLYCIQK